MSRRIIIETAERDAKLYKRDGQLLLYVAKVVVNSDTVTMTPLRGITESDISGIVTDLRQRLLAGDELLSPRWAEGPDGWFTSHVSARVDVDGAIAQILDEAADTVDR